MDLASFTAALEESEDLKDFVKSHELVSGHLCINGLIALQLAAIAPSIDADQDVEIIDETGQLLCYLCLRRKHPHVDLASITDAQHVAYLIELESKEDLYSASEYSFKADYILILRNRFDEYKSKYMSSSTIWGGFQEKCDITMEGYKQKITQIAARPNVTWPTKQHALVASTSAMDHFSLERYLKLYHLLELGFDWDIVKQIQELQDDLKGIGKLLANHGRDEMFLLKQIVAKCSDSAKLEQVMSPVFQQKNYTKAIEIFFAYEKESNPLKTQLDKFEALKVHGSFSLANAKTAGLCSKSEDYEKKLRDIAAYWIYRTRCGIAHHRIGEYIITLDDEFFIVDFMEPLIKEVIMQAFTVVPINSLDYSI